MKKLPVGMERYIVKKVDKLFRVYDKARGSFPVTGKEWGGSVQQDVSEAEAAAEADRLNGVVAEEMLQETVQLENTETVLEDLPVKELEDLPVKEEDIEDYGVMSEEERAAYEDGLLEKVTY